MREKTSASSSSVGGVARQSSFQAFVNCGYLLAGKNSNRGELDRVEVIHVTVTVSLCPCLAWDTGTVHAECERAAHSGRMSYMMRDWWSKMKSVCQAMRVDFSIDL
jgi:hypothetical protein